MAMTEDPNVFFNTDDFAFDATYTPPGGSAVLTKAIIDHDIEIGSLESFVTETITSIGLIVSDVGKPVRNAAIVLNSDTYNVERIIKDDGFIVTVAVRKI